MWCIYIILVLHFDNYLSNVSIIAIVYEAIGVACVRVGRVANLCVTNSGMMQLTLTCGIRGF
jgi:hypothetical protein